MTRRERNDAIFQAALMPATGAGLTTGLAESIHEALVGTPQVRASRWSIGGRGFPTPDRVFLAIPLIVALLALVAFIAILASRPSPGPLGVVTYRGGPERTGVMPGPGPAGDPILDWQFDMNGPVAVMPVILAGTVYVADVSGTVQALDEGTGQAVWATQLNGPVNGSPAIAGGRLFLGTDAGDVVALDVATGTEVWRFQADGPVRASPAVVGDVLYVGSDDGNVYSLDLATGDPHWARSLGAPVTRGVAISAGVVYAGATGGRFTALDAGTGAVLWSRDDLGVGEVGTPMVADGLVFVASGLLELGTSDRVTALDIRDGREHWHFASPDGQPVYAGAVGDGAIYVSSSNGDVHRLDEVTGDPVPGWTFHADGGVGYLSGLVGNVLYVPAEDRFIHAVDVRAAKELWRFEVQGAPNVPAILDGRVFVGTNLGKVVAIGGTEPAAGGSP